jgi:hypothetical protein
MEISLSIGQKESQAFAPQMLWFIFAGGKK